MTVRTLIAIAASATVAKASPTTVGIDAAYTTGDTLNYEEMTALALRLEAAHTLRDLPLTLRASFSVVYVTVEEEGETDTDTAPGNPSFFARYALRWGALELGATAGIIAALDDDEFELAKVIHAGYESARRPYELGYATAVPAIADVRYAISVPWSVAFEVGAYFTSGFTYKQSPLEDVHLALGTAHDSGRLRMEARAHALFVPGRSRTPLYYEPARRSYFGVELGAAWAVGSQRMRVTVWKPFGYDSPDATVSGTTISLGAELRF